MRFDELDTHLKKWTVTALLVILVTLAGCVAPPSPPDGGEAAPAEMLTGGTLRISGVVTKLPDFSKDHRSLHVKPDAVCNVDGTPSEYQKKILHLSPSYRAEPGESQGADWIDTIAARWQELDLQIGDRIIAQVDYYGIGSRKERWTLIFNRGITRIIKSDHQDYDRYTACSNLPTE